MPTNTNKTYDAALARHATAVAEWNDAKIKFVNRPGTNAENARNAAWVEFQLATKALRVVEAQEAFEAARVALFAAIDASNEAPVAYADRDE